MPDWERLEQEREDKYSNEAESCEGCERLDECQDEVDRLRHLVREVANIHRDTYDGEPMPLELFEWFEKVESIIND